MKYIVLTFIFCVLTACKHSTMQSEGVSMSLQERVEQELQQAINNKDYRLYGFQGRRMTLPGIPPEQTNEAAEQCGYKLMSGTGDVVKSEQQRQQRNEKFAYATLYNKKMRLLCEK